jgi:hypothetical protein
MPRGFKGEMNHAREICVAPKPDIHNFGRFGAITRICAPETTNRSETGLLECKPRCFTFR